MKEKKMKNQQTNKQTNKQTDAQTIKQKHTEREIMLFIGKPKGRSRMNLHH